jgi:hypothetical protein
MLKHPELTARVLVAALIEPLTDGGSGRMGILKLVFSAMLVLAVVFGVSFPVPANWELERLRQISVLDLLRRQILWFSRSPCRRTLGD